MYTNCNYITANESSSHSVVKLTQLVRAHPCSQTSLPLLSSSSSSAFIIQMETWTESLISSTAMLPELSMSKMRNAQLTSSLNLVDYVDDGEFPTLKVLNFFTHIFSFNTFNSSCFNISHFVDPTISIAIISSVKPIVPPLSVSITLYSQLLFVSLSWQIFGFFLYLCLTFLRPRMISSKPEHKVRQICPSRSLWEESPEQFT